MAQKVSFDADDKKKGMSLAELQTYVERAVGLAETNGTNLNDAKVFIFVNFGGGIKQLVAEV
jgi:hypothetical protein